MAIESRRALFATWILALTLASAGCAEQKTERKPPDPKPKLDSKKEEKSMNQDWSHMVDPEKARKATAVLRVRYRALRGGNKYTWDTVDVIHVIENRSQHQFPESFDVAHYDTKPGVPQGESTIYLEPYNDVDHSLWKLLDGTAEHGVSHGATEK